MTIMVVAHRKKLRKLMNIILELYPEDIVVPIDDGMSAVQFVFHNPVDMVYTELQGRPLTGFDVGRMVRKERPNVAVCLIADTADYVSDALRQGCNGYYLMPISVETLRKNNLLAGKGGVTMGGEEVNLEELYQEYFPKIYNFFFYKLLHREDAEDLTEQTFLKVAEKLHTYNSKKAKIGTWIGQISENTLIDFYRTEKRTLPLDDKLSGVESTLSVSFEEQYGKIANPVRKEIYAALYAISERDRLLVYHKYLLGWSYHEIADKFKINESTLASVLQRAKEKMRDGLAKQQA